MFDRIAPTPSEVSLPSYLQDAITIVRGLSPQAESQVFATPAEIERRERELGVCFPQSYRSFLEQCGALVLGEVMFCGLGVPPYMLPSVVCATNVARKLYEDAPQHLVPLYPIQPGIFASLDCSQLTLASEDAPVVEWDVRVPPTEQSFPRLADSFAAFLLQVLLKETNCQRGMQYFRRMAKDYQSTHNYDHAKGGKLPRNTEWRPFRYCVQDVVFGFTIVRHHAEANCLQVDAFLTANIPEYGPRAGARALAAFLLSEAYKCGGTMEIRFSRNVEGGNVPTDLRQLAMTYGVRFAQQSSIQPSEAKQFYTALTGFSLRLREQMERLERDGRVKMARACYVVNHGIWSREQLEMIILGSENPDGVLGAQAQPEQWHLYSHDLIHARAAILAGAFERVLLQRERQTEQNIAYDMEDDLRTLDIDFDGDTYTKTYRCSDTVPLAWLYGSDYEQFLPENVLFQVLIRARDLADMQLHLNADLELAGRLHSIQGVPTFLLLPADFEDAAQGLRNVVLEKAKSLMVGILVSPDTVLNMDSDAADRLARSRVLRQ